MHFGFLPECITSLAFTLKQLYPGGGLMLRSKNSSPKSMSMKSTSVVLVFALSVALILFLNLQHAYYAKATGSANTIEDTFNRANQAGWGTTTNYDSVPN